MEKHNLVFGILCAIALILVWVYTILSGSGEMFLLSLILSFGVLTLAKGE
jgi:hypothetical protein